MLSGVGGSIIFFAGFFLLRVRLPPSLLSRGKARVQGGSAESGQGHLHFSSDIRNRLKENNLTSERREKETIANDR